jgi:FlaA1/EpsC-like NDP-sugar epimerase
MSMTWLTGKSVLITGASGTVAGGLLRTILEARPRVVRALDSHEHGLFSLRGRLGDRGDVRWLLGDVRDLDRLRRALEGIDVVFHCAALKHVALGEYNPFEVVQTNLLGLQNVIQAGLDNRVDRVIFTSSDKAVNPTNAMGASKLMGERLIAAANEMSGTAGTRFASVRFGNILGSSGSVVDVFREQIARGGPVTLTDRRMTRFVMGLDEAVRLTLLAAEIMTGGEVFVLKMPVLRIAHLADVLIEHLAPCHGYDPSAIGVVEIGPHRGEKLFEELLAEAELPSSYENDALIVYLGEHIEPGEIGRRPCLRLFRHLTETYSSDRIPPMTRAQVETFLEENKVLDTPVPVVQFA